MRFVILHHHIFKNAGSTLDAALKKHFGSSLKEIHPDRSDSARIAPEQLFGFLEEKPAMQAVSSHHFFGRDYEASLDAIRREQLYFFDVILLRHPVSRLTSIYLYYRSLPRGDHPLLQAAHDHTFPGFIGYVLDRHPNFANNSQVTMLGCTHYGAPPSDHSFSRALKRLMAVSMLGTVERFAESMVVAEYFMQPVFPGLLLNGHAKNASERSGIPEYDGTLDSIKAALGNLLFNKLCTLNDLDIKLWSETSVELERRERYVPDFEEKLVGFLRRPSE